MKECAAILNQLSHQLSDLWKEAGKNLEPLILNHLKDLNFLHVDFSIDFTKGPKITRNGFDRAEFVISVNPGEPQMPLAKTASGGEMSRIMLAIRSVLNERYGVPTAIYDEVDTGISGRTARKVGIKLASIAGGSQVVCVTHSAQIASLADAHYVIEKRETVEGGETRAETTVRPITEERRVEEIARILGGLDVTDSQRAAARELIAGKEGL